MLNRRRLLGATVVAATARGARAATPPSAPGSPGLGVLRIESVNLTFGLQESGVSTATAQLGVALPAFRAIIRYTGTGTLSGRWEFAGPTDPITDERPLLPLSQMSSSERDALPQAQLLESFSVLLPPLVGNYSLSGPSLHADSLKIIGAYRILLRISDVTSSGRPVAQQRLPIKSLRLHLRAGKEDATEPAPTPVK
jgi:hypothetical protein